ncbi:hypothetical protein Bca52824_011418 [Brassica carinata]|uniref:Uncharacterized protein n=1 Tax=Brassica carinata TaxID=52824 RepID=A0A8X8BB44_BRACI|nr:hypothetical protein Bca52824_011418 [Brassica carinata]
MANSKVFFSDLKAGRCSSVVEARLLRFWEAKNVQRGGELMWADLLFVNVNSLESRSSQAQKALVRVFTRSIEIDVGKGVPPGALVKAKLLIMGECRHVQKALSHVSSKLRENLLPRKDLEEMRARVGIRYENGGAKAILSVSNGEQDLKMVRSGTEVMKSIYQLMHTEIVNEVNGFTPPTVLENGLRTQSNGVSLRNVTLELAVEKDVLTALYGRDGAGVRVDVKDAPTEAETMVLLAGNLDLRFNAITSISSTGHSSTGLINRP